jgi:hypothetical protein
VPADLYRGGTTEGTSGATLPPELQRLVVRCVSASGTHGRDRATVERELVAHLQDAIDAGWSIARIADDFGDPEQSGWLIGRARARLRRRHGFPFASAAALGSGVAVACIYAWSAFLLHSGRPARAMWSVDDIPAALTTARGLDVAAASQLVDSLLDRMYTREGDAGGGHLTAEGLRIVQRLKGVEVPSTTALVVEPVYFAFPAARQAVRKEADRVLALAERARLTGPGSAERAEFEREAAAYGWSSVDAYRYVPLAIGSARPQRMRSRLVLPLPLAPAMRSSVPLSSENVMPSKSCRSPRTHATFDAASIRPSFHVGNRDYALSPNAGHALAARHESMQESMNGDR